MEEGEILMTEPDRIAEEREILGDGYDQPHEVPTVKLMFPADLGALLPAWDLIPESFRKHYGDADSQPWKDFQSTWFFKGISRSAITPRPDVDKDKALRHLSVLQGSYEPKHEHKEAAVAWLASRWFKAVKV